MLRAMNEKQSTQKFETQREALLSQIDTMEQTNRRLREQVCRVKCQCSAGKSTSNPWRRLIHNLCSQHLTPHHPHSFTNGMPKMRCWAEK